MNVLAVNNLDDGATASPAITGDTMVLRTHGHVYGIREMMKP